MSSGYSNDKTDKSMSPTIEQYVAAGYPAASYPPSGYPEVDSPGLVAFRAYQADPHDAIKHATAATALGVSVGELEHGRVMAPQAPVVEGDPGLVALNQRFRAEQIAHDREMSGADDPPELPQAVQELEQSIVDTPQASGEDEATDRGRPAGMNPGGVLTSNE